MKPLHQEMMAALGSVTMVPVSSSWGSKDSNSSASTLPPKNRVNRSAIIAVPGKLLTSPAWAKPVSAASRFAGAMVTGPAANAENSPCNLARFKFAPGNVSTKSVNSSSSSSDKKSTGSPSLSSSNSSSSSALSSSSSSSLVSAKSSLFSSATSASAS